MVVFTALAILWAIYYVRYALRQIQQSIVLDEESITLFDCAARMENDSMRVDAGTVTLKWSEISSIEQRLIRMNTGEVYSDSAVYESGKFSPKTKASPFGEKGWAEINRYYARYKENNKQ